MSKIIPTVHPSELYKSMQAQLTALEERRGGASKASVLRTELKREFMETFHLWPTRDKRLHEVAARKRWDWTIDHSDHFKSMFDSFVLVTQPYVSPNIEAIERSGIEVVDLNEWGYYYPGPGHAQCWAYVIHPKLLSFLCSDGRASAKIIFTP